MDNGEARGAYARAIGSYSAGMFIALNALEAILQAQSDLLPPHLKGSLEEVVRGIHKNTGRAENCLAGTPLER